MKSDVALTTFVFDCIIYKSEYEGAKDATMLSIKNNKSWEDISIHINGEQCVNDDATPEYKKTLFLLSKMMGSIYYRLWDLVTQSKYDNIKKGKMKTELKRITIGCVEKCLQANANLSIPLLEVIERYFTSGDPSDGLYRIKINNYANYAIDNDGMKPHFIDSSLEIADLEFKKLKRRLELNDFDFSHRPTT